MSTVYGFSLFVLGLMVGSFLNVIILRFREERGFFHWEVLGGRSRCPHCGRRLDWYELIPLVSFFWQKGRCRACKERLSLQYPLVEFISGLIFLLPIYFLSLSADYWLFSVIWIISGLTLIVISAIDLRFFIIPDQLNFFLALLGAVAIFMPRPDSFLGPPAMLAGFTEGLLTKYIVGAVIGGLLLGLIYFVSRGRAIGFGDVKLAAALGLLLGWPDIMMVLALAFVIGAVFGLFWLITGRKKLKTAVPFGPFIAAGTIIVVILGNQLVAGYFNLFSII